MPRTAFAEPLTSKSRKATSARPSRTCHRRKAHTP
jgi:hypothetical protein